MKKIKESIKPNKESITLLNDCASQIRPDKKELFDWFQNYANNHLNRLSFDLDYLLGEFNHPQETSVLEIGSLPLLLTLAMQKKGFQVTGFDVNPARFSKSIEKLNLNVIQGSMGEKTLPFKDNTFDAVIMNEVFEHLNTNLISVVNEIKRVLKPNGKVFISTPNLRSLVGIKNFLVKGKAYSCCGEIYEEYEKIGKYGHMGHVREYTPQELITFLNKLNFDIYKLIYRGKYPKKYRIIEALIPSLKPFFSIIAVKK